MTQEPDLIVVNTNNQKRVSTASGSLEDMWQMQKTHSFCLCRKHICHSCEHYFSEATLTQNPQKAEFLFWNQRSFRIKQFGSLLTTVSLTKSNRVLSHLQELAKTHLLHLYLTF